LKNPELLPKLSVDEAPNNLVEKYSVSSELPDLLGVGLQIRCWRIKKRKDKSADGVKAYRHILPPAKVSQHIPLILNQTTEETEKEFDDAVDLRHQILPLQLHRGEDLQVRSDCYREEKWK